LEKVPPQERHRKVKIGKYYMQMEKGRKKEVFKQEEREKKMEGEENSSWGK